MGYSLPLPHGIITGVPVDTPTDQPVPSSGLILVDSINYHFCLVNHIAPIQNPLAQATEPEYRDIPGPVVSQTAVGLSWETAVQQESRR